MPDHDMNAGNKLTTQAFGRATSEVTLRGDGVGEVSMFNIWGRHHTHHLSAHSRITQRQTSW
jgi:hypothetical protein